MQRPLLSTLALSVLSAAPLLAQTPGQAPAAARPAAQRPAPQPPAAGPGEVRGSVVDAESSAPVARASVAVWSAADSALVAGAIARPDGSFRIEGLRPGTYYLRVSMMGYGTRITERFTIAEASPRAAAGSVRLTKSALVLEGLSVTAERQAATLAPDRNTYGARSVAPAATTASEVLEAVPSVQVDADGRVSLRGNENVVVQINGRPSPIRGAQLAGYLKQLPANTLDRVEVVPNPSAKYDPEGMAGIINIVLKQNVDLGLSGGLTLGASTADRYVASGNLGYQRGPATLALTYGFTSDDRTLAGVNDRTRLGAQRAATSYTEQDIRGSNGNGGHNATATLDLRLGERDVLSQSLQLNARGSSEESFSALSELDATRQLLDQYERVRDQEDQARLVDYTLAWKRTLQPQRHEISAELRANATEDEDQNYLWRQPLNGGGRMDAERNLTEASSRFYTAQLDYTRTLAQRTKLETGYRGTLRDIDRDFLVQTDALGSGQWLRNDRSNALSFSESVNAVYGVLSHAAGKVEMQGGLRAEYANRNFSLASSRESFPYDYVSFFPSGLLNYKLSDQSQVKLSYSRRVRRPGTQELNPFPNFFDQQNVFLGNPRLNPEYTDAVELGFQRSMKMGSVQLSPFYRRTTDVIRFIVNTADTVAGREATSISFKNLDSGSSWGTDLNGQLRLGQMLSGLASFNVFQMVTEGGSESSLSTNAVTWSARLNGTLNVSPKTSLTAAYFYRAPMNIEGGRFESMSFANFSVRYKLLGERASVTLRASDPFNTQRFRVRAGDDNVIQLTERTSTSRALHLTFQSTFGRPPRLRQRPQQQEPQGSSPFGG
jgi:outer membrane receptor protein involved in Fe transport